MTDLHLLNTLEVPSLAPTDCELLKPRLLKATVRAIREETIFVDTNSVLSVFVISFTYFNTEIYYKKASLQTFS